MFRILIFYRHESNLNEITTLENELDIKCIAILTSLAVNDDLKSIMFSTNLLFQDLVLVTVASM